MARLNPITVRQRELLGKIADPPPDWSIVTREANSVYALRSRGLVRTRSPMAYMTAKITEQGRDLLDGRAHVLEARTPADRPPATPPRSTLNLSGADVIAQVMAADGELRIADPKPDLRHLWRQGIHEAAATNSAPKGKRLRHRGRDQGDLVLWLEDTALTNVAVPHYP